MTKRLLTSFLFFFCILGYATKWTKIVDTGQTIYIDLSSIKKNNDYVFYSSLQNMASMGLNSVVIDNKADCIEESIVEFNVTFYDQTMGRGIPYEEEIDVEEIVYLKPNTTKYKLMKFACNYQQ